MSECKFCATGPATYFNWDCPGCRVRWLATLPTREWRQQVINQWRKDGEVEMVAQVIKRLKAMA